MAGRLLIADSDPHFRESFERFFSHRGFQVETAADGLKCLAQLRSTVPQLLVVELEMPWGGGDGVLDLLHRRSELPAATGVVVTGRESPDVLSHRTGLPRACFFSKPLQVDDLLDPVLSHMQSGGHDHGRDAF